MCIRLRVLGERFEGTYAQYVKLPGQNCFPIPNSYSFHEAAAFPLVFITLWRMVITNAALQPGETMLIIGIGGGVASATLQVAKQIGARVIVTSGSDAKLERAKSLGADHGVNHHRESFVTAVQSLTDGLGVDVVLDCVGGEVWRQSLASLGARRQVGHLRRHRGRPAARRHRGDRCQTVEDLRLDAWAAGGNSYQLISFLNASAESNRSSTACFRSARRQTRSATSKQRSSSARLFWRYRTKLGAAPLPKIPAF